MNAQKFRKKPVEIEAVPLPVWGEPNWYDGDSKAVFDSVRYVDKCIAIAEWCGGVSHMMVVDEEYAFDGAAIPGPHMTIPTLEGEMIARPGDWIIRGVKGEFYPCKPDIFTATHDEVPA